MGSHDPFWHLKHKLWSKERPLKVENCPDLLMWKWRATSYWKALDKSYNFVLDFISIGGLHTKLWAPKVVGVPIMRILRFPFRRPMTKWHLGADPVARHKVYYKGEGDDFPQVGAVVNLMSPWLLMACLCMKVL